MTFTGWGDEMTIETSVRVPASTGLPAPSLAVSTVIFSLLNDTENDAHARETSALWIPLVKRIREPFRGNWALPGGPIGRTESLEDAARRNLRETTGVEPKYLEQLYAFGGTDRSPSDRVVSIVYWALVPADEATAAVDAANVRWFPADDLPELAFDHSSIVDYALSRLRNKVGYSRIAHAFLGEMFTLTQLRQVYEAVLRRRLDPANFRRQLEASGSIVPTDEYLAGAKHRPPRLYRYDASVDIADNGPLSVA